MVQKSIAVLITCHNRASQTLHCLKQLFDQQGIGEKFSLSVYLVDDNSKDGTSTLIGAQFPLVNIIQGNGNLYWNRGMNLAWTHAVQKNTYDLFLWLNDDAFLFNNALSNMINVVHKNSIVVGATASSIKKEITFGAYSENHQLMVPNNDIQRCSYFNGNCVLIPNEVYQEIGGLDPHFHHALGDFDYGLRAKKKGIQLLLAPISIGTCEAHTNEPKWANPNYNIIERLKNLYSPLSGCSPGEFFTYERRHYGTDTAVLHFFTTHLRVIFPKVKYLKPLSK